MRITVGATILRKKNLNGIEAAVRRGVANAAFLVQSSARYKAPVDSGALKQSIKAGKPRKDGNSITAAVSTSLEYAPFVEFGTGARGAATNNNTQVEVSYRQDWKGSAAQPFLWPALRENKRKAAEMISEEIRKATKK